MNHSQIKIVYNEEIKSYEMFPTGVFSQTEENLLVRQFFDEIEKLGFRKDPSKMPPLPGWYSYYDASGNVVSSDTNLFENWGDFSVVSTNKELLERLLPLFEKIVLEVIGSR